MKAFIKTALLAACLSTVLAVDGHARDKEGQAVYIFGYGQCFSDSTVYLTSISRLPASAYDKKTKLLHDRSDYSAQLESFLASTGTNPKTCAVFFATKKSAIEKKLTKVRHHLQLQRDLHLCELPQNDFTFQPAESQTQE